VRDFRENGCTKQGCIVKEATGVEKDCIGSVTDAVAIPAAKPSPTCMGKDAVGAVADKHLGGRRLTRA